MTASRLRRLACLVLALLVAGAAVAQPKGISSSGGDTFTLNLKNADITTLIATVSEVTGRNFVVDPRVKGNVTVLSNQSMTPKELYETFLSVLDVHGYAAVPAGEVTKIVPQVNAKQDSGFGAAAGHPTRENIITRVVHVGNVPADQLVPILRPLVPQYGHLAAYAASNSLIISDREANVRRLTKIVDKIDRNGMTSVERIPLQHANASDVAGKLKKLKSGGKNAATGGFSVIPDQRTNSVIISGDAQQRRRLSRFVANLDANKTSAGNTQVIYLNYADAETLAPIIQSFVNGRSYSAGSSGPRRAPGGSNNGFGNNGFGNSGSGFGNSGFNRSNFGNNSLGNAAASGTSARTRTAGISGQNSGHKGPGRGISVIAEAPANALIITVPPDKIEKMAQIKKVISQLDIRRAQVLVEAIIAEVTLNRSRKLGVNVAALRKNGPAAASILDSRTLNRIPSLAMSGTPLGLIQQGLNVALSSNKGSVNFALLINALSSNSNTNILSTPSLITRDNQEAQIEVGKQVPFVTGNFTTGTTGGLAGGVSPFQTIERREVGLQLAFTPQISKGDTIQLTIDQEISSIVPNSLATGASDLITNNRSIKTAVEIQNGQILVLGGLIKNNVTQTQRKVPLLGDIPLIGALFRYNSTQKTKRNLLNFIRPTILRGKGEANYYTRQKYNYLRSLQKNQAENGVPLINPNQLPHLPPIGQLKNRSSFSQDSGVNGSQPATGPRPEAPPGGKRRGDRF